MGFNSLLTHAELIHSIVAVTMGTSGLIGFIIKGKKRGLYMKYDAYPDGLGLSIMRWIQTLSNDDIARMVKRLKNIKWYRYIYRSASSFTNMFEVQVRWSRRRPFAAFQRTSGQIRTCGFRPDP
jgi:hypothetical protein